MTAWRNLVLRCCIVAGLIGTVAGVVLRPASERLALGPDQLTVSTAAASPPVAPPHAVEPALHAAPRFLHRTYRAPRALVRPGAGGSLLIPSLGVRAPVDAVGLDGTTMAIPDDPHRVGWLRTTASATDLVGSSVLSGHVSDVRDVPGALSRLGDVHPGAVIVWTIAGEAHQFVVTGLARYPRSRGVPASVFRTDGAHVLNLVTCADRVSTPGGGFHYTANLVVTARAATHSARRAGAY